MEAERDDDEVRQALRHPDPGKCRRLAAALRRYGEAIEYDLTTRGVDVAQLWRRRRWRLLLNLIDRLPQNSHYVEAQAQDDELAQQLARLPEQPPAGPRWSEWSPEREALATVIDRLGDVITNMAVLNKAKPPRIRRQRRPDNAMRRIREDQRRQRHEQLVLQLLPDKDDTD